MSSQDLACAAIKAQKALSRQLRLDFAEEPESPPSGDVSPRSRDGACARKKTVIILDWDDTLLCSSVLQTRRWSKKELQELERVANSVLRAAMDLGETMIVTNGNMNWVKESASRYLPGLVPLLSQLTVVSARSQYEDLHPGDPFMWKRMAFKDLLLTKAASSSGRAGLNLVVVGDQSPEIQAAHFVAQLLGNSTTVKTVKFRENPSVAELHGQLGKLQLGLSRVVNSDHNWDQRLVRRDMTFPASCSSSWRFTSAEETGLVCDPFASLGDFWKIFD